MQRSWQLFKADASLAQALAQELNLFPLTAQVLINRGIKDTAHAAMFLKPSLNHLRDPLEIPDAAQAVKRVLEAREKQEKVLVFGDYDVDGVTGTAILIHALASLGIKADHYIPHRYEEGYSLSLDSVRRIAERGTDLIITVDCGVSSLKEIALARSLGIDVIVTDHHNIPDCLPPAHSMVNPKRLAKEHPSCDLSGAGVAFKFAWALLRLSGSRDKQFLASLLDLAALGTISDVVPLTAENRVLAVNGLKLINSRPRPGLKRLIEVSALKGGVNVNHVYFALAPRINAAGRLEHASTSLELLLTDDESKAGQLARELNDINLRRRDIGGDIKDEVLQRLETCADQQRLCFLSGCDWHPGVIGIVASQIVDRFCRPAVLVGINDGVGRGSARSVEGLDIFALLNECRDLFIDFGGHAGAAGFEIEPGKVAELEQRLNRLAGSRIPEEALKPKLRLDAVLDPAAITLNLIKELEMLAPHGEGNPQPVFMSQELELGGMRCVGKDGRHLKLKLNNGGADLDTIGFGLGYLEPTLKFATKYDVAYMLEANEWDGFETAQLKLADIRPAEQSSTLPKEVTV
ncbi:MAG: single-stranded-DNA-specific exonuclease RecJ [Candidatus Saganbacteria bacterium]|nr:single-stranded-DNA-specific exonuclease RecJ [Candidatus Saganbacteria bacterium]